jgi:uncharacterized protein (TIGR00369 family)
VASSRTPAAESDVTTPAPPPGFELMQKRGVFSQRNGPYFSRPRDGGVEQAFFALPKHCNSMGIVHGGMLSAFLDGLLASAIGLGAGQPGLTIHLSIDFLAMARAGEWVIGEARMSRKTREVAFADARIRVGGRDVVHGSGVFKLMHGRRSGEAP